MKIVDADDQFIINLRFQFANRREVVLSVLDMIEEAETINELRKSPCSLRTNHYLAYNDICKVYFEYFPNTNTVKLWNFVFKNHF